MEWLVALIGTTGIGFLLHAHIVARSQLSAKQLRAMRDLIERESMRIKAEREKIIARNPTLEKTIPLSQVVEPLERSKEIYKKDRKYIAAVERTIDELKRRYDGYIPVDEI